MKYGGFEGSREEIKGLFEDSGVGLADLLDLPRPKINPIWIGVPTVIFFLLITMIIFVAPQESPFQIFFFVSAIASSGWALISAHLRFENQGILWFGMFVALTMLVVATGVVEPKDVPEMFKESQNIVP